MCVTESFKWLRIVDGAEKYVNGKPVSMPRIYSMS